jgi:preprotein translocase subunit SecY
MKVLPIRRYLLWAALAVVVVIVIYRIGFHRPVPGFNEEAVRSLTAK